MGDQNRLPKARAPSRTRSAQRAAQRAAREREFNRARESFRRHPVSRAIEGFVWTRSPSRAAAKALLEVIGKIDLSGLAEPFVGRFPQTRAAPWTEYWDLVCARTNPCWPNWNEVFDRRYSSNIASCQLWCNQTITGQGDLSMAVPSHHSTVHILDQWDAGGGTERSDSWWQYTRKKSGEAPSPNPENPTITALTTNFVWPDEIVVQPAPEEMPINWPIPTTRPVWPPGAPAPGEEPSAPGADPSAEPARRAVPFPVTLPGPVTFTPWPSDDWYPAPDDVVIDLPPPGRFVPGYGSPEPGTDGATKPDTQTRPGTSPGVVVVSNDGRGVVTTQPNSVVQAPPPKGTVQRKPTVSAVAPLTWAVMNFATEAFDFIGAMHGALPKGCRRSKIEDGTRKVFNPATGWRDKKKYRALTPYEMTEDLIRCVGGLDIASALENYVNMQLTDMFFGMLDQWAPRYYRLTGQLTGVGRALNQGSRYAQLADQDAAFDAGTNWRDYNEGLNDSPVPKFDIDPHSGEINVTWFDQSFTWDLQRNTFTRKR